MKGERCVVLVTGRARARARAFLAAIVLAAVATISMLVPPATPASAASRRVDPRQVPVRQSSPAPRPASAPPRPAGSFAPLATAAGGSGSHFDAKRSKLISRSMFQEEYLNPDGTHSIRQSTTPLAAQDASGRWQAVDPTLRTDPAGHRASARSQPLAPSLAAKADDPAVLALQAPGGGAVSLALDQAAASPASVQGSHVTYAQALPGTDLQYQVTAGTVKETILLQKAPARSSWSFHLTTGGLTPVLDRSGEVLLEDGAGVPRLVVPPVQAWDSNSRTPAVTGGAYRLTRDGAGWRLTVSVAAAWLRDAHRVYPVHVDPTITLGVVDSHDYRSDGFSCDRCGLNIGNSQHLGDSYNRAVFNFDWTQLFGRNVVGARMDVTRDTNVVGSLKTWNADLYWASAFDFNGVGPYLTSALVGDVGSFSGPGLTSFIANHVNARDATPFFMMIGSEIPGTWTFKVLNATLTVDTGSAPPATSIVAPADTSVISGLTPTLSVAPVTNPDGDPVSYCFQVATGADARSGVVVDSGCLPGPQWTVPAGVLQDGTAYTWQASTYSGITTTTPSWVGHFTVDQRIGNHGPAPTDTVGPAEVNLANGNVSVSNAGPTFTTVGGAAGLTLTYNSRQTLPTGLRASYYNDLSHNGNINSAQQPALVRTEPQVNDDWGASSPFAPALAQDYYVVMWEGTFQAPATGTYLFAGVHSGGATIWVNGTQVYTASGPSDVNWTQATGIQLTAGQQATIKVQVTKGLGGAGRMRLFTETSDGTTVPPQIVPSSWLFTTDVPALPAGWSLSTNLDGTPSVYTKAQVADSTIVLTDASGAKHTWTKASTGGYTPPQGEDGVLGLDGGGRIALTEGADVYVFNPDGTLDTESSSLDSQHPAALQHVYDGSPLRLSQIKDPVSQRAHVLHYNRSGDTCYGGATPPPGADALPPAQMLCRITYWDGSETRLWYSGGQLSRIENPGSADTDYAYSGGLLSLVRDALANDWVAVDPANRNLLDTYYEIDYASGGGAQPLRVVEPMPLPTVSTVADRLLTNQTLTVGQSITSKDGRFRLVLQADGNLVLYAPGNQPLWASNTMGKNSAEVAMQSDGNLVIYDPSGVALWWTGTTGTGAWLVVQNDGNLVIYDANNHPLWAAASNDPGAGRPQHGYRFDPANHQTFVDVAGLQPVTGFYSKVTYDGADRALTTTDATGRVTSQTWSVNDLLLSSTDEEGRVSTTVYDYANRPVDEYGPGPASCFSGQLPTSACASTVPHTHTGYDEGIAGLSSSYYDNVSLTGTPKVYGTGVGTSDGSLAMSWGSGAPAPGIPTSNWSARFTGEIQLPDAGTYGIGANVVDGTRVWIDDQLVVDGWTDHTTSTAVSGTYANATAGAVHRIRVDYYDHNGSGLINLTWQPPGQSWQVIPGADLHPRYGLATSTVTSESGGVPDRTTATGFGGGGLDPVYGLQTTSSLDPAGLHLTQSTAHESPGSGYLRDTGTTRPNGVATANAYYGDTETRANPCVSGSAAVDQGGLARLTTSPAPASGGARTDEQVYDASGRLVAKATSGDWACTSYDARGRVTQQTYPALGSSAARTVTHSYAVNGDPLTTSVSDPAGTVTTITDLLGRVVSYTDVTSTVTTTTYDQAGRVIQEVTDPSSVDAARTTTYTYDDAGRQQTVTFDGTLQATVTYDSGGEMASVTYANGSSLASIGRDSAGNETSLDWRTSDGKDTVSAVTRTRAGTITNETVNGVDPNPGGPDYVYDAAGRLTGAYVTGHHLTYDFTSAAAASCPSGTRANAGANTNRMRLLDQTAGGTAETDYCYDGADRLIGTLGSTVIGGVTYDSHGNTTSYTSGGLTTSLGWDGADRNVSAAVGGGGPSQVASVAYTRDADNRIVRRNPSAGDPQGTTVYGYTGSGDSSTLVYDGSKHLLTWTISLPGGVLMTQQNSPTPAEWDYSTIRGDILFSAQSQGTQSGGPYAYDPYGQPLDANGTVDPANVPANQPGLMSFGWLGEHQRPYEHAGALDLVEMGARPCSPLLGRFLSVDPVEGGSANDYEYTAGDPVNHTDLNGQWWSWLSRSARWVGHQANRAWHAVAGAGRWVARKALGTWHAVTHWWNHGGRQQAVRCAAGAGEGVGTLADNPAGDVVPWWGYVIAGAVGCAHALIHPPRQLGQRIVRRIMGPEPYKPPPTNRSERRGRWGPQ